MQCDRPETTGRDLCSCASIAVFLLNKSDFFTIVLLCKCLNVAVYSVVVVIFCCAADFNRRKISSEDRK